tara:strand:+ start:499 stop:966 length:468 start_codon:yes stop_codon:yes gene_type:complete
MSKVSETLVQSPKYKIKSYTMFTVFILVIIGFVLLVGVLGPDFFAIIFFLFIMVIPVLILFRDKFINILPSFLSNNLLEIDHSPDKKNTIKFNPSKYTKQVGLYIIIVILLIGAIVFLKKANDKIDEKKIIMKIMGGLICIVVAGSILLEVDYIV